MRSITGSDSDETLKWKGVVRDKDTFWKNNMKRPGSSAGWASLAYQASERADQALQVAQEAQEDAQKYSLIARGCADQARAAQLQQELTSRTVRHTKHQSPEFKAFCEKFRHDSSTSRGGSGGSEAEMEHLGTDCEMGELNDFCVDLKMYLKSKVGKPHFRDPEMIQLRKFCGGLQSMLDKATGSDAPFAASELAKVGYEDGFTLYDNPPEVPFKQYKGYMKKGRVVESGYMTVASAKERCLKNTRCKGFATRGLLFGIAGSGAKDNSRGWVDLRDKWEDPTPSMFE